MTNDFKIIDEHYEAGRRALGSYVTGFILSILLTLIPYFVVVRHLSVGSAAIYFVVGFAMVQLFVQVIFFLHLNKKSRPYWNMIVFIFAIMIVAILVVGSIWVMYNLNYNMMDNSLLKTSEGYIPQ